jgi:hypothetical protein
VKFLLILFAGSMVLLSGCSTTPRENDQQAFESSLAEAQVFMMTLQALDSGDIEKARHVGFVPVYVDILSLPDFASRGHPTVEQKQQMVEVARQALDYMLKHKEEFGPEYMSNMVRGLRKILTEPEDVRRLQELSDYCAEREKKMSDTPRP